GHRKTPALPRDYAEVRGLDVAEGKGFECLIGLMVEPKFGLNKGIDAHCVPLNTARKCRNVGKMWANRGHGSRQRKWAHTHKKMAPSTPRNREARGHTL